MTGLHRAEQNYQDTRRRRDAQTGLTDQDQPHPHPPHPHPPHPHPPNPHPPNPPKPAGRADRDLTKRVIDVRERNDDDTGSTSRP